MVQRFTIYIWSGVFIAHLSNRKRFHGCRTQVSWLSLGLWPSLRSDPAPSHGSLWLNCSVKAQDPRLLLSLDSATGPQTLSWACAFSMSRWEACGNYKKDIGTFILAGLADFSLSVFYFNRSSVGPTCLSSSPYFYSASSSSPTSKSQRPRAGRSMKSRPVSASQHQHQLLRSTCLKSSTAWGPTLSFKTLLWPRFPHLFTLLHATTEEKGSPGCQSNISPFPRLHSPLRPPHSPIIVRHLGTRHGVWKAGSKSSSHTLIRNMIVLRPF